MSEGPFNPIDAAVFALIVVAVFYGIRAGFLMTAYSLASWILAVAAAIALAGPAAKLVEAIVGLPAPVAATVGFIAVIVAAEALLAVAGHIAVRPVAAVVRRSPLSAVDRALGAVPATFRTLFIIAIAILAIEALPLSSEIKAAVEGSRTARLLNDQVAAYQPQLGALTSRLGGSPILVTKVGEDQTERLALPEALELAADPVAERQLFDLVNEERAQRGRPALVWDDRIVPVARAHSEEMFKLKYFSHESPVTGSPFDRLKAGGIAYSRAGENLAYAQSVGVAHHALMDSPGHRENILRAEFTRAAIGVVNAGAYGRMITQLFIAP